MKKLFAWTRCPEYWNIMMWIWFLLGLLSLVGGSLWWCALEFLMGAVSAYVSLKLLEKNNE